MNNDLQQALDQAAAQGREVDVFFRDDDADDDIPNLHRLLDTFGERGVPISLEVIPGTLTSRGADLLRTALRRAPGLLELNQHGWMHTNHESAGRKHEFGPSRNYDQRFDDIRRGCEVLNDAFGQEWRAVFTPPWNRCTLDTLRAVNDLGFTTLSRDSSQPAATGYAFREISITFDIYSWKQGARMKTREEIASALAAQVRAGQSIGILLHHKVLTPEAFTEISELVDQLKQSVATRFHTLESMLTLPERREWPCTA